MIRRHEDYIRGKEAGEGVCEPATVLISFICIPVQTMHKKLLKVYAYSGSGEK